MNLPDAFEKSNPHLHDEAMPPGAVEALRRLLRDELPGVVREAVRNELAGHAPPDDGLLTKKQVARRLNVSERTVDTLAAEGSLRKVKVRGAVRFAPDAVDAYIRRQAGEGAR
jgi:excisionase family DNA binding protein